MCGITAIFNYDRSPASSTVIREMTNRIAHRGPDGEGYYVQDSIALGHRRLAILDTSSAGAQPMSSKDGNWIIIFNGCIYNFQELRIELQAKGHVFNSGSDTEVITEGLAAFGIDYIRRFNGMFAIVAWHKASNTLFLSRDRFGVKPLYYWQNGKTLLVASEIKAFMAHPDFSVKLNYGALNEYFTFQNVFTYNTLFNDVVMLPPANTVKVELGAKGKVKHDSWWDYEFVEKAESMSFNEAKEETVRLLQRAVARQMISDVPVGSYLSGGMDSCSLASMASHHVQRLTTFTAGFDMSYVSGVEANYDERRDAEIMASYLKTEHYEQVINASDLGWSLPRVVWHLEDLRMGMSYPNYYISRLASKFVKVCLQGTGGDELYGGYPWRYYRIFRSVDQKTFFNKYYEFWQRLVPENEKSDLFVPDVRAQIDIEEPRRIFERVFTFNHSLKYEKPEQHINNSLYFEIKTFLPGLLLVGDKLSMANGLEERFPFLDNDLVEFAQKIPVRYKLENLEDMKRLDENVLGNKKRVYQEYHDGKNVLRKAMLDFIPEAILKRKKQGFSAPDESWYRGQNAAYVRELLLGKNSVSLSIINETYVRRMLDEHIEKKINHRLLIWSLMNFEWWCRHFLN